MPHQMTCYTTRTSPLFSPNVRPAQQEAPCSSLRALYTRHETLSELTQRYMRQGYHASRPSRLRTHRPADELTSPSLHSTAATALLLAWALSSSSSTAPSEPRAVCPSPRTSRATHLGRVEDLTYVEAQRSTRRLAEAVRCFGGRSGPCRRSRMERSRP